MSNNSQSIVIEDLVLTTTNNIQEISSQEAKKISGGATISFTFPDYTYSNNDGEVVETGTRPDGLEFSSSESPDGTSLSLNFSASS